MTPEMFTERDRYILDLLAAGKSNAEIAYAIGISRTSVGNLMGRLYDKIGTSNRVKVAVWWSMSHARL